MNIEHLRHTLAHLLAAAVKGLYPDAKPTIGPAIENGFYYDFDNLELSDADLPKIEEKMRQLLPAWKKFEQEEVSAKEAKKLYKDNPYKQELVDEIAGRGEKITLYTSGGFTDLCRGGHVKNPSREIDPEAFKLTHIAGAYWRGSEKNKMLTRIYGAAFNTKAELEKHLAGLEEAKKRDHRVLGRELDLFSFHEVSPGAAFWHPKGMIVFKELEKLIREETEKRGYQEISTPIMVKKELWERSGHWEHYKENMFVLEVDEEIYSLKPMNCPESTYIYNSRLRSWRDLPLRLSEIGRLHRNEIRGALGGLFRVRQLTMDDAHIYCRPEQIESEITALINFIREFYAIFGFEPRYRFSTKPEKALGSTALWEKAESGLKNALKKHKLDFELCAGEGAFYGPKIDILISDALGREWQMATIQLDFQMPERFELAYIDERGEKQRPAMIHRAVFGSFERFVGVMTEHFAGAFPTWLSPVQVVVLAVSDKYQKYAQAVVDKLREHGVRTELPDSSETLSKRIREAELQKVPYILVVGEKEEKDSTVNVRRRKDASQKTLKLEKFLEQIRKEIASRAL